MQVVKIASQKTPIAVLALLTKRPIEVGRKEALHILLPQLSQADPVPRHMSVQAFDQRSSSTAQVGLKESFGGLWKTELGWLRGHSLLALLVAFLKLSHGATELICHIGHGEIDVLKGGLRATVPHHSLQHRKTHSAASHIGAEGMSESVGIRIGYALLGAAAITEQAAKPSCRHRLTVSSALQHHE